MITSCVKNVGGVPTFIINDKPVSQTAYITYFEDKNCYQDFADCGYNLFSVPIMFATRTVNEAIPAPVFINGIYENEKPDYSLLDESIRKILDACPDAYIFPRVNVNLPIRWEDAHPDELCFDSYGEKKCACFASDEWAEEVKRLLKDLITYIENSDYKDHIVAYQISGGNTEEWFPIAPAGGDGKRAREKFDEYYKANNLPADDVEYRRFLSKVVAQRIMEFASFVKECTGNRLAVGSFYGYTMTCHNWESCHHALSDVLRCPDIDFLCSPICYSEFRKVGRDAYNMLPIDSVKLHNKLYFVENDSRTHLTRPPFDTPKFQHPIWFGNEKGESREALKMHFSRALTHGHALWWFDMWGGWFKDDDYMNFMSESRKLYEASVNKNRSSAAEVGVFIDEKSYALIKENADIAPDNAKRVLGLSATPYDIYLADDFESVYDKYKAIVFIIPAMTLQMESNIEKAKENNIPYLLYTPESVGMKPEEIMEFFKNSGVHVYANRPCVVYASQSHLFLHTAEEGEYDFNVEGIKTFTDIFTNEKYEFPCYLKSGQSYLFER